MCPRGVREPQIGLRALPLAPRRTLIATPQAGRMAREPYPASAGVGAGRLPVVVLRGAAPALVAAGAAAVRLEIPLRRQPPAGRGDQERLPPMPRIPQDRNPAGRHRA